MKVPVPDPPPVNEGLTSEEARERLSQLGPNEVPEEKPRPWVAFARKFWAPVPWMLELTLLLEVWLGRSVEGAIIGVLLLANAAISQLQEGKAQAALLLLRQQLAIQARVRRDGRWQRVPARELVSGDVLHLRLGDIVPADTAIRDGALQVNQAVLTGESTPKSLNRGETALAGATVVHGEATGVVSATGLRTQYGRTVQLVEAAGAPGHASKTIMRVVQALVAMDLVLVIVVSAYARHARMLPADVLPFLLILLLASVPVALPATFTLATALGAMELARRGILVTRLASLEEAAGMDVACLDKTGTLTANKLSVTALVAFPPASESALLRDAVLASDEATQDPLDLAILDAARAHGVRPPLDERVSWTPFEPKLKRAEAEVVRGDRRARIVKGSPHVVSALAGLEAGAMEPAMERLAGQGARVLAVAALEGGQWALRGLIGFQDPPREDAAPLIRALAGLGIRALMITGDSLETARAIASQVGLRGPICPPGPTAFGADCVGYAGVLPEDKFHLIRALQQQGHRVGMTGDGVNDAPALKQAEVGVAVANATDVARAAASLVLTQAGLAGIVAAVETSRRIFQRLTTYTLNKIIKTFELSLFLSGGLLLTGTFVTTPRHVLLLMLTNDFVTMAIATDRVTPPRWPQRWRVGALAAAALVLAVCSLVFSGAVFWWGRGVLGLPLPALQTLTFVTLAFSTQGTVYVIRERGRFWRSTPSRWLMASTTFAVVMVGLLATSGFWMAPIPSWLVALVGGLVLGFMVLLDGVKIGVFQRLGLGESAARGSG